MAATTDIDLGRVLVRERTLHLVDLENLLGDGPPGDAIAVLDRYLAVAGWRRGDLVYLACNPGLARSFVWELGDLGVECVVHTACGRNGADLALLAHAAPEFVARRAGRLVVGSGDGIFVARAAAVRDLGVDVLVVSRPGSLHGRYRHLGFRVAWLPADVADVADVAVAA